MTDEPSTVDTTRGPRRWLWRLLLAVVLFVALAAVLVESLGRRVVEHIAEGQIRAAGVAGQVEVRLGRSWWTPSLSRVLISGDLDRVDVRLRDASLYSTPVAEADYVLDGLSLDISVSGRRVSASSIESGRVLVKVDPSGIARMLGVDALVSGGRLLLGPDREAAELEVDDSNLVIDSPVIETMTGLPGPATFPVMDPQILPCRPDVRVRGRFVELFCTGNSLPGVLAGSIGGDPADGHLPDAPVDLPPPASIEVPNPPSTTANAPAPTTTGG